MNKNVEKFIIWIYFAVLNYICSRKLQPVTFVRLDYDTLSVVSLGCSLHWKEQG
jgi:hypothetical protein